MKQKSLLLLLIALFMLSCSNDIEETQCETTERVSEKSAQTRSVSEDSTLFSEPTILMETEELRNLTSIHNKNRSQRMKAMYSGYNTDEYFSSNMYAIRELPLTIKVRSVASGSSSANSYLFCSGKGKEVTLGTSSTALGSKFNIRVLPATAGVPYLIYSNAANTPLAVGQYNNAPDDKILMASKDESGSLFSIGWSLLPSTYKGYFSIQSESYLGQSDPNNMWSVFNYVLEAKFGNKLRYAQRVSNKAQQEFLITPDNYFTIDDISFDLENATISNGSEIKVVKSVTNSTEYVKKDVPITVSVSANETSFFNESAGVLKLKILPGSKKFVRPIPIAGKAVMQEDANADVSYTTSTTYHQITKYDSTCVDLLPQTLLQLTVKFKTFILNVPYVATAKYTINGIERIVKVKGTWRGYSVANPQYNKPIYEPRFYDLESGDERYYSLEYNASQNKIIVK